jgi:hypothetical protein
MSTGHQFFEYQTPRAMLEKARRELAKLQADRSTDNFFNLVITTNHIRDYAEDYGIIPKHQLPGGKDFQLIRELANMAKHLGGSDRKYKDNKYSEESVTLWDEALWDKGLWDGKEAVFEFQGKQLDILKIAEKVINAWGAVLTKHGL